MDISPSGVLRFVLRTANFEFRHSFLLRTLLSGWVFCSLRRVAATDSQEKQPPFLPTLILSQFLSLITRQPNTDWNSGSLLLWWMSLLPERAIASFQMPARLKLYLLVKSRNSRQHLSSLPAVPVQRF